MNFSKIALATVIFLFFSTATFSTGIQDKKDEPPAVGYSQPQNEPHQTCGDKPLPLDPGEKPKFIRAGEAVMSQDVVHQVIPVYPKEAKEKHIAGTVVLGATITADGKVSEIHFLSGPYELKQSAMDAVAQWRYKLVYLNCKPVNVGTTISVSYPWETDPKASQTPFERLQAKTAVVSAGSLTPPQVAGQFNNPSEEQNKLTPPMGRDRLFLFPDKTYIYTFETDISPDTISDKGTWTLNGDIVDLKSDEDITWRSKRAERRYVLVRRAGHDGELFAVGTERELKYFEEHAKDDPEFMFLLNSLKRERPIVEAETAALHKKLMRENWKPGLYTDDAKP
jgi:TonB family protein